MHTQSCQKRRAHWRQGAAWASSAGVLALLVGLTAANLPEPDHAANPQVEAAKGIAGAFHSASSQVLPAVVMISTESKPLAAVERDGDDNADPFAGAPFGDLSQRPELRRFFKDFDFHDKSSPFGAVPRQRKSGIGSGVIIDAQGVVLTNNHVVAGGDKVTVRLSDGREFEAVEVKTDPDTDLAIVRIQSDEPLPAARLGDSDKMQIGDWVLALGQPFGLEGTVTSGIISAKGRGIGLAQRENYLQTDAAINPGNSGGPLVNLDGEVIAINTAISSHGGGNNGVGFAVPVNEAKWVVEQLLSSGHVQRAQLGVMIQPVTHELSRQFGVKAREGVLVAQVNPGSPAADAGLVSGDVIVQFAGKPVATPRDLQMLVERCPVGDEQTMVVVRGGQRVELSVKCSALPDDNDVAAAPASQSKPSESTWLDRFGFEAAPLGADVAERLGMKNAEGLVITEVDPNGAAAEAGLASGMVITQVDRQPVTSVDEFEKLVKAKNSDDGLLLLVRSDRGSRFVVVHPRA